MLRGMSTPPASSAGAAPRTPLKQGRLCLRPTTPADCPFVVSVERHPDNVPHVEDWSEEQHRAALDRPGIAHWIIEHNGLAVGYAVLEGTEDPNASLLLRRIAIVSKGRGIGRGALLLIARFCFDVLGFHRLWLNVATGNRRAFNVYRRLGFVEEGVARESVRVGDRFISMRVLSMLDREYRALYGGVSVNKRSRG